MALDFLKLHDDKLVQEYKAKPEKDILPSLRKKVMDGIKKAMESVAGNDHQPRHKWYGVRDGNSLAQVRLGRTPLVIEGKSEFGVPREQLVNFYTGVARSCEAGELDDAIRHAHANRAVSSASTQRSAVGVTRTMSPEHKEKIAAARRGFKKADGSLDLEGYRKWVKEGSDKSKLPK